MIKRFGWTIALGLAVLVGIVLTQLSPLSPWVQAQNATPIAATSAKVVHLKHGVDDARATFMALNVANDLQERGSKVTLLLTMEGTQIADARHSLDVSIKNEPQTLAALYDRFVAQGGQVKVCPDCAAASGLTVLRSGADLASGNNDIASLLMDSNHVIDF
jgi:sulfur relay (sulfurtransferase) complex TusBCD TusD component (DsrE family)